MNLAELTELVKLGESDRVEFKKTTGQRVEGMRTACAMLNGAGGFVLFGLAPDGVIRGMTVTTETLESVHNELRRIEPPAFPGIETVVLANGLAVIALRIPGGAPADSGIQSRRLGHDPAIALRWVMTQPTSLKAINNVNRP